MEAASGGQNQKVVGIWSHDTRSVEESAIVVNRCGDAYCAASVSMTR